MGGPDMAPQTPQRSEHPCSAVGAPRYSERLLDHAEAGHDRMIRPPPIVCKKSPSEVKRMKGFRRFSSPIVAERPPELWPGNRVVSSGSAPSRCVSEWY